jgi:F-type H+-transporting ATPase subunit delta
LEGRIHERLFGFLCLAVDKNREAFIVPSLTELIELIRQHQRKTTAKVVSAIELNENQLASLTKMLSEKLDKQVDIDLKVDPSVIGGMYVYVDGYFIDRLLINRLSEMTVSMKERCGA